MRRRELGGRGEEWGIRNRIDYLRYWFWKCKEYIVNEDANWSDERRKRAVDA
jgi:hypothetical protein